MDYSTAMVPDNVKQFVVYFYRHIRERNIKEIGMMYEVSFTTLSERHFKNTSWPPVEFIADLVDKDHVFCLLYKEMYFRHLYATTQPSLEQRVDSYKNYCALLNVILTSNVNMQLPNVWLWDMIDEFIYQFQSFQQYVGRLSVKSQDEVSIIRDYSEMWNTTTVLNYLQALVDKSGIVKELEDPEKRKRLMENDGYDYHSSNVLRMLGYCALVGLSRVHAIIGDFHTSIQALYPINPFQKKSFFAPKVAGLNIALYYYSGFSFLMLRRYVDAAIAFNSILSYIARVKHLHTRSNQHDLILKKNEQIYALLALVMALCPATAKHLNDAVLNSLKERHSDKLQKLSRGNEAVYEELFAYACPKFITASPPTLDAPSSNMNQEAYRLQWRCFASLVLERKNLPDIKALLKLYSSISLTKLASLLDNVNINTLRSQLILLKSSQSCITWCGGNEAISGQMQPCADIDFVIELDPVSGTEMINVTEPKFKRKQPDVLLRDITRFKEIIHDLKFQQFQQNHKGNMHSHQTTMA